MPRVEPNPGKPWCKFGYTQEQLKEIMGKGYDGFREWMSGQTQAICDGKWPCSVGHGTITYEWDLDQYLKGGRPLD